MESKKSYGVRPVLWNHVKPCKGISQDSQVLAYLQCTLMTAMGISCESIVKPMSLYLGPCCLLILYLVSRLSCARF